MNYVDLLLLNYCVIWDGIWTDLSPFNIYLQLLQTVWRSLQAVGHPTGQMKEGFEIQHALWSPLTKYLSWTVLYVYCEIFIWDFIIFKCVPAVFDQIYIISISLVFPEDTNHRIFTGFGVFTPARWLKPHPFFTPLLMYQVLFVILYWPASTNIEYMTNSCK